MRRPSETGGGPARPPSRLRAMARLTGSRAGRLDRCARTFLMCTEGGGGGQGAAVTAVSCRARVVQDQDHRHICSQRGRAAHPGQPLHQPTPPHRGWGSSTATPPQGLHRGGIGPRAGVAGHHTPVRRPQQRRQAPPALLPSGATPAASGPPSHSSHPLTHRTPALIAASLPLTPSEDHTPTRESHTLAHSRSSPRYARALAAAAPELPHHPHPARKRTKSHTANR